MGWPLSQDYNEAIQTPSQCFSDAELRQGEAVTNALGLPAPCSGNFADVYAVTTPQRKWAVKCFTRQIPGIRERYIEISKYLAQVTLPFMVDFKYLEQGIRIRGQWYPVLKMDWVQGFTLNQFVKEHLDKPAILDKLCQLWVQLSLRLREANLAHCDLQHGNVLLVQASRAGAVGIKLVDYDGMCVPSLTLLKSIELGHPSYQHPQRLREGLYGLDVDRFSHLAIYTALRSLMVTGKSLWDKYDNGDNLLFRQQDFEAPTKSALFADLLRTNNPEVRKLAGVISDAAKRPMEQTPLLDSLVGPPVSGAGRKTAPPMLPPDEHPHFPAFSEKPGPGSSRRRYRRRNKIGALTWAVVLMFVTLVGAGTTVAWLASRQETGRAKQTEGIAKSSSPGATAALATTPTITSPTKRESTEPPKATAPTPTKKEALEVPNKEPVPSPAPELDAVGEIRRFDFQGDAVWNVAFTPDPRYVVTTSHKGPVIVWDTTSGKEMRRFSGITSCLSSDGNSLISYDFPARRTRLWDARSGKPIRDFDGNFGLNFSFFPDNRRVVSSSNSEVIIWDSESGKQIKRLPGEHVNQGQGVAVSPDSRFLLTVDGTRPSKFAAVWTPCLWSTDTGDLIRRFDEVKGATSVVFSPDGRAAVFGCTDGSLQLCNLDDGKIMRRIKTHASTIYFICFSSDGQRILAASMLEPDAVLWDMRSNKEMCRLQGHTANITGLALSSDGTFAFTGSRDATARLWRLPAAGSTRVLGPTPMPEAKPDTRPDPKPILTEIATRTFGGDTVGSSSVAFSPDGKTLASGSRNNGMVKLWAVVNGKITATLGKHTAAVSSVAFSPDGKIVASASWDRTVKLWDVASGKNIATLQGHAGSVESVAFSPDGKTLASGSKDKTIILWDVNTGTERATLKGHTGFVYSVAFSPDGKTLASGSGGYNRRPWGEVKLWEIASGKNTATLQGHSDAVSSVAFSPDGKTLAAGCGGYNRRPWPGEVKLWEIASGKNAATLQGHSDEISSVAFSPDGKTLATGSRDQTIKLWDMVSGKNIATLKGHTGSVESVAFSPDGKMLASGSSDRTVKLWEIGKPTEEPRLAVDKFVAISIASVATADTTKPLWGTMQEILIFPKWGDVKYGSQEIPFFIAEPKNGKKNGIVLRAGWMPNSPYPKEVSVPCNVACKSIHLLSGVAGSGFPQLREKSVAMVVRLHYADGSTEDHELRNAVHFTNLDATSDVPGSKQAFRLALPIPGGSNRSWSHNQVRYLAINPKKPTVKIDTIEFLKGAKGDVTSPVVVAVTAERP